MIIKPLLIVLITGLFIWFLGNRTTSRMRATKKLAICIFFLIATISIMYPDITERTASLVGVGRGADLILYMTVVTFIAFMLNQYARSKEDEQRIVKLARKLAIIEANNNPHNKR